MNTVVVQPLTPSDTRVISCRPMGQEPIEFDWSGGGCQTIQFDESRSEATNVAPGRYRVRATDANGDRADVIVDVEPVFEHAVVITEYRVRPASTRFSRDGEVTAIGSGMTGKMRYLWTSGVETDTPCADAVCGTYAVVAIGVDAPTTIHRCAPARVDVA